MWGILSFIIDSIEKGDKNEKKQKCFLCPIIWGLFFFLFTSSTLVLETRSLTWNSVHRYKPGHVAQLVGYLTGKSEVLSSIPGLATYFRFSFC